MLYSIVVVESVAVRIYKLDGIFELWYWLAGASPGKEAVGNLPQALCELSILGYSVCYRIMHPRNFNLFSRSKVIFVLQSDVAYMWQNLKAVEH